MTERVVLRTFSSRSEAQAAQSILAGSSIDSFVASDDCGAVDPGLAFGRGVDLLVAADDLVRAEQVMSEVVPNEGL
jgi:hypothetical protein